MKISSGELQVGASRNACDIAQRTVVEIRILGRMVPCFLTREYKAEQLPFAYE